MRLKLRTLFLVDGLGALLSAFMLGVVLVRFENNFGIPASTLYILAAVPCAFVIYDMYCYFKIQKNLSHYLKYIAIANLAYCILSISLSYRHLDSITRLGWIYILLELAIIIILAILELRAAQKHLLK